MSTHLNAVRSLWGATLVCIALGLYIPRVSADSQTQQPAAAETQRSTRIPSDLTLALRALPIWTFSNKNNAFFIAAGLRVNGFELMLLGGELNANLQSAEGRLRLTSDGNKYRTDLSGLAVGLRLGWKSSQRDCWWYGFGIHGARVGLWDTRVNSDIGGYTMGGLAELGIAIEPFPYFPTASLGVAAGYITSIYNAEASTYGEVGLRQTTGGFVAALILEVAYDVYRMTSAHSEP